MYGGARPPAQRPPQPAQPPRPAAPAPGQRPAGRERRSVQPSPARALTHPRRPEVGTGTDPEKRARGERRGPFFNSQRTPKLDVFSRRPGPRAAVPRRGTSSRRLVLSFGGMGEPSARRHTMVPILHSFASTWFTLDFKEFGAASVLYPISGSTAAISRSSAAPRGARHPQVHNGLRNILWRGPVHGRNCPLDPCGRGLISCFTPSSPSNEVIFRW